MRPPRGCEFFRGHCGKFRTPSRSGRIGVYLSVLITHMAYRAARIGWRGHSREAFALAAVFSLVLLPFLIRVRRRSGQ
jgi:hypothetical protein